MTNQRNQHPILIVEDSFYLCKFYEKILVPEGYQLKFAENGVEAIYKTLSILPNLIILDIMMPHINGLQVLELLKTMRCTQELPVLIITAKADPQTLYKAGSLGANVYLKKPFSTSNLLEKVNTLLKQGSGENEDVSRKSNIAEKPLNMTINSPEKLDEFYKSLKSIFGHFLKLIVDKEKKETGELITKLIQKSDVLKLSSAKSKLVQMQTALNEEQWDLIIHELEDLFFLFKSLRLQLLQKESV